MNYYNQANRIRPNNRLIGGGFFGPFLLGGITGGLLAPAFYRPPYAYGGGYYPPYPYQNYYNQTYYNYPYGY